MFLLLLSACKNTKESDALIEIKKNFEEGNYQEVINLTTKEINNHHGEVNLYIYNGLSYANLFEDEKARTIFEQALNVENDNRELLRGYGICLYILEEYEEALTYFSKALAATGAIVETWDYDIVAYEAKCYFELGEYEKAIERYEILIDYDYQMTMNTFYRGLTKIKMGLHTEAIIDIEEAIKRDSKNYTLYIMAYEYLLEAELEEEAVAYLHRGLSVSETDAEKKYFYCAKIDFLLGNYEKAAIGLGKIIQYDKIEILELIGLCSEMLGDYDEAIAFYLQRLNDHVNPELMNRLACCYMAKGKYTDALQTLNQALIQRKKELYPVIYMNIILTYEMQGDIQMALEKATVYSAEFPKDKMISQKLHELQQISSVPEGEAA